MSGFHETSRMIDKGYDDYTVRAISGHSSTRMLARYTHRSEERKTHALGSFELKPLVTNRSQSVNDRSDELSDLKELLKKVGGRQEARTPDLRVANER